MDASPPLTLNRVSVANGEMRESIAPPEVPATDDDNSVYRFCGLKSNVRVSQITVFNDPAPVGSLVCMGLGTLLLILPEL